MPPIFRSSTSKTVGAASTTWVLSKPSGTATGDLLIVVATAAVPTVTLNISGSGWSSRINELNFLSEFRATVWWKIEDGTTIGTVSWDGSSVLNGGIVMCYSGGIDGSGPPMAVEGWTPWSTPGAGNPTSPSLYIPAIRGRTYLAVGISDTDISAGAATGLVNEANVNAACGLDRIPAIYGPTTTTITGASGNNAAMGLSLVAPPASHDYSAFPKTNLRTVA